VAIEELLIREPYEPIPELLQAAVKVEAVLTVVADCLRAEALHLGFYR
jgi:hypothetical protein